MSDSKFILDKKSRVKVRPMVEARAKEAWDVKQELSPREVLALLNTCDMLDKKCARLETKLSTAWWLVEHWRDVAYKLGGCGAE